MTRQQTIISEVVNLAIKLTHNEFIKRVAQKQPNIEVLDEYTTAKSRMRAKCKRCGRIWESSGESLSRGNGCIHCASVDREAKRRISTDDFKKKLSEVTNNIEVLGEYRSSTDKIHIKCTECGHEWLAQPYHLLEGHGCPECLKVKASKRFRSTHETFVAKLSQAHPDLKVDDCEDNVYETSDKHLMFVCSHGHKFSARPNNILQPTAGCPICKESYGEQKIRRYLEECGLRFQSQKTFPGCALVRVLPFDFYIESLNTIIEFDGQHHYMPIKYFGGDAHLQDVQKRDEIKTQYCTQNGINLVRIPYWDFDNIEHILSDVVNSQRSQI